MVSAQASAQLMLKALRRPPMVRDAKEQFHYLGIDIHNKVVAD